MTSVKFKKNNAFMALVVSLLALVLLFGITTIILADSSSKAYVAQNSERVLLADTRVAVSYINNRVRQADSAGAVSVRETAEGQALVITHSMENKTYETWIYVHNSSMMELMKNAEDPFDPAFGFKIVPIKSLKLNYLEDIGAIEVVTVSMDDRQSDFMLKLRSA